MVRWTCDKDKLVIVCGNASRRQQPHRQMLRAYHQGSAPWWIPSENSDFIYISRRDLPHSLPVLKFEFLCVLELIILMVVHSIESGPNNQELNRVRCQKVKGFGQKKKISLVRQKKYRENSHNVAKAIPAQTQVCLRRARMWTHKRFPGFRMEVL